MSVKGVGSPKRSRFGVGFDFDHTLGIDNKIERVAFLRLLERLPKGGARASSLDEQTAAVDALLAEQRSGKYTIDEAVKRFVRTHAQGVTDSSEYIRWYKKMVLDTVDDFVIPLPGAGEMLAALQARNVPVAILSNGWSPLQQRKAACIGFHGPILVSDEIGALKPDKVAFERLLQVLQIPANQAFYVGDNPAVDVGGCMRVGMRGVWLDAEGVPYPPNLQRPSHIVHALSELLRLLPGPVELV